MFFIHVNRCHRWKQGRHCVAPDDERGQPPGRRMTGPVEGAPMCSGEVVNGMSRLGTSDNGHMNLPNFRNRLLPPRLNVFEGWDLELCCFQPETFIRVRNCITSPLAVHDAQGTISDRTFPVILCDSCIRMGSFVRQSFCQSYHCCIMLVPRPPG